MSLTGKVAARELPMAKRARNWKESILKNRGLLGGETVTRVKKGVKRLPERRKRLEVEMWRQGIKLLYISLNTSANAANTNKEEICDSPVMQLLLQGSSVGQGRRSRSSSAALKTSFKARGKIPTTRISRT